MKGQAFVGLPSEQSAEKALRETNGYVLYDKPLVVVSFYPLSQDQTRTRFYTEWKSRLRLFGGVGHKDVYKLFFLQVLFLKITHKNLFNKRNIHVQT